MELAHLTKLANLCHGPQVGIVHHTSPTYIQIPEETLRRHHALQKDGQECFVVITLSINATEVPFGSEREYKLNVQKMIK